jgi:hypothetical protein
LRAAGLFTALVFAGCFSPDIKDGAYTCIEAEGFLCPEGLSCLRAKPDDKMGTCVAHAPADMAVYDATVTFDFTQQPQMRTCDERVRQGAFSNLTNLGAVNSAGDEHSLALSFDGKQIYFLDGAGVLQTSTLSSDGKSAPAPTPVTLGGTPPATFTGGSFASDGSLWFTGANGNISALYQATKVSATMFTVGAAQFPSASPAAANCLLSDAALTDGDSKKDLYVSWPLAGCSAQPMIAQGQVGKYIGAFVGAVSAQGFHVPSVVAGGQTMLMASIGADSRLWYAERPTLDVTWSGPTELPLGAIGQPSGRDAQGVVNQSCSILYLVSQRAGGKGGLDLWAADIAAQ